MSLAEKVMWLKLRQIPKDLNLTFRRQHPILPYFVDFICLKQNLIIELDGNSHDLQQKHDKVRDTYLANLGYRVLRFTNDAFLKNPDGVVETIIMQTQEK